MNNRWRLAILLPLVLGIAGPAAAQTYRYKLSSGLFGVPDIAAAVDWGVVNNGTTAQTFVVTIYQGNIGAVKSIIPPGALTFTMDPGVTTHNANDVGATGPFLSGFFYEVVVETNSLKVLPTVEQWSSQNGASVIPGLRIGPGDFVRIR